MKHGGGVGEDHVHSLKSNFKSLQSNVLPAVPDTMTLDSVFLM